MRRTIKLSESELKRMISESVKRTLNEWDEYYQPDEFDMMSADEQKAHEICDRINNGKYDNILDKILSYGGAASYFDLESSDYAAGWVSDAAFERKCIIDKDFAFKRGWRKYQDYPNTWDDKHPSRSSRLERYSDETNKNRFNNVDKDKLGDKYWSDKEARDLHSKYPSMYNKKGELRGGPFGKRAEDIIDMAQKAVYGTDQADKRPLHRKGSLNRAMDESVNRKINRIVSESIKRNLR